MSLQSLLEDFGAPDPGDAGFEPPAPGPEVEEDREPVLSEEERLAAFEKGYAEGYEDATKAAEDGRQRVGEALAERLKDLSFTYEEARAAVLREVRDLMAAIGDGVLPAMGREGFGAALAEAVVAEIEGRSACPVAVSVAPSAVELVEPLMPQVEGFPVTLRGDADLDEGQAVIGFPDGERELDMGAVVERAMAALNEWIADAAWTATAAEAAPDEGADAQDDEALQEAANG